MSFRSIQPAPQSSGSGDRDPSPASPAPGTRGASKRSYTTPVACLSCRSRKTKCDGHRPTCAACTTRGVTECIYDMASDKRRTAVLRETIQDLRDENEQLKRLMADMCSAHRRNDEAAKNRALQCLEAIGYSKDSVYAMPDVMQGVGRPLDVVNDVGLSPTSFSASGASAATTLPYYQGTSGHSHSHGPNYATFPPQLSAQTVTSGNTSDHSMSIELLNEHFQFDHDVQERANDTTTGHQLHYRPFQR